MRGVVWQPLELDALCALFTAQEARWWVAGGLALELFLGRSWRAHADIDVGVLRRDQARVFAALAGWELHAAHRGALRELAPGETLPREVNGVWCRRSGGPWSFQIVLDDADGSDWQFRRLPAIRRPLASAILRDARGVPYLAPEIQLLYKARDVRPKDAQDFAEVAPQLDRAACDWLREALSRSEAGHPWLARAELER